MYNEKMMQLTAYGLGKECAFYLYLIYFKINDDDDDENAALLSLK